MAQARAVRSAEAVSRPAETFQPLLVDMSSRLWLSPIWRAQDRDRERRRRGAQARACASRGAACCWRVCLGYETVLASTTSRAPSQRVVAHAQRRQ